MIKLDGIEIKPGRFPDGTSYIKCIKEHDIFCDIEWYYEDEKELITLYYLVSHLRNITSDMIINLYMPYIPNARMDRVKSEEEIFTLKYFSNVINSMKFDSVLVLDPHSYVSMALLNGIEALMPDEEIKKAIKRSRVDCIFFPDEGAMKRYSDFCKIPYTFGVKNRDWATGKINSLSIYSPEVVKGKKVLIVDDICSKGGTFYYSALELLKAGATEIYLYVTHCEHSIFKGQFGDNKVPLLDTGLIKKVYTTNSIFTEEHDKIEVFNVRRHEGD